MHKCLVCIVRKTLLNYQVDTQHIKKVSVMP